MSQRFQLLQYKDGSFFLIRPVAASDLELLDYLLAALSHIWIETQFDTLLVIDKYWQLVEAISQLIPTHPILKFDVEKVRNDAFLFQSLFLRESISERDSIIAKLHKFESLCQREPVTPGVKITAKNLPFPSCGIASLDQLASLMYSFEPGTGLELHQKLDAQAIDHISYVLGELNKPEQERVIAYLDELYEQNRERMFGPDDGIENIVSRFDEMIQNPDLNQK